MKASYVFPSALALVATILGVVYYATVASDTTSQRLPENSSTHYYTDGGTVVLPVLSTRSAPATIQKTPVPVPVIPAVPTFTIAAVREHSTDARCYTAINGNVYDVSSWITTHPGGADAIRSLCGTDGTAAFTAQHGGRSRPEAELASFFIGTLTAE